jgi:hypothetical protein
VESGQGSLSVGQENKGEVTLDPTTNINQHQDMNAEYVGGESSKGRGNPEGKGRVSFGTDMTLDEESSDGGSNVKMNLVLAMAVDRFHARKFGVKSKKRGALKVCSAGKVKKQKTPNKSSRQGALATLDLESLEAVMKKTKSQQDELMEEAAQADVAELKSEPQHLMGTLEEARQEQ